MEPKKMFEKYYSRLRIIGLLKAFLYALIVGFGVNFVIAAITWFAYYDYGMWLAIGVGVGMVVLFMPIFYFRFFKPTTQKIARMVDKLGLEERLITMYELENDESYIAMLQREDTKAKMESTSAKSLKIAFSTAAIVILCVLAVLGAGMTTVTGLAAAGILPGPTELIPEDPEEYTITFEAADGGFVEGMIVQIIPEGEDGEMVFAMEDDGYVFIYWLWKNENGLDQMSSDPAFIPRDVHSNLTITAYFMQLFEFDDDIEEGEGIPVEPDDLPDEALKAGNKPSDKKPRPNQQQAQIEGGTESAEGPIGTPGRDDNNTVIDGQTQYETEFNYEQQTGELASDDTIPDDYKDVGQSYFDSIKPLE